MSQLQLMVVPGDVGDYLDLAARYGDPILEIGRGSGQILLELAAHGHRVVGVDLSPVILEKLHERLRERPAAEAQRVLQPRREDEGSMP